MTTRVLKVTVPATAAEVIERLADQTAFPSYAEDILSVSADGDAAGAGDGSGGGDGRQAWVLAFRGGTADWVQDVRRTGPAGEGSHRIVFEQVSGDFQELKGSWTSTDVPGGGSEVAFEISYRTSVPHLAGAIDSAVGHVLVRSAHQVVTAVAGGPVRVTDGHYHLGDPTEHLRQS
ncbi:SRPBCC family protein [Streptomyces sp. NPDC006460]|uniref:SRPBCC family protein n=1 Tax=Streptomyces sp. NPDC006460 TaxID=3154304 RepID=UPI0033B4D127